jgi:hypothetical protein
VQTNVGNFGGGCGEELEIQRLRDLGGSGDLEGCRAGGMRELN